MGEGRAGGRKSEVQQGLGSEELRLSAGGSGMQMPAAGQHPPQRPTLARLPHLYLLLLLPQGQRLSLVCGAAGQVGLGGVAHPQQVARLACGERTVTGGTGMTHTMR